jgi:hypothetical protein
MKQGQELTHRDTVLAVVFVFTSLIVAIFLLIGQEPNIQFWICAALSLLSFAASQRKLVLVMTLFAFAALRFAFVLVIAPRWEAAMGLVLCGGLVFMLLRRFPNA